MGNKKLLLIFLCFSLFFGCSGKKSQFNGYRIGLDPTWYPIELAGKENNVLAFSIELLQAIAKREGLEMSIVTMSWDNLLWGLRSQKYNAALSSLEPYAFYQSKYSFSDLYLMTGPVLVASRESPIHSMRDIDGKEIGVVRGSRAALLLQKYPGVIIRGYNSVAEQLAALEREQIDAAMVDILIAQNYVRDLYHDQLKIVTGPISDRGLRLVSLFDGAPELMKKFDRGLKALQKDGTYERLLEKWGLSPDGMPSKELSKKIAAFLGQNLH